MGGDDDGCWLEALIGFVVGVLAGAAGVGVLAYLVITWATDGR